MGKKYRITLPMSKEKLLYLLNQTTQNLTIQNQAYRKTTLANYDKKKEILFVSYAAGSMNGGGWEMLKVKLMDHVENVILEGEFVMLPHIKRGAQFFLIIMMILGVFFSQGDFLLLGEILVIFIIPLLLLYKNLPKIVGNEEGRELVLQYFSDELNGKIEVLDDLE